MDSLKIPKGGSSNATSGGIKPSQANVPITVRFNAGDECIDDIFQSFHNNSNNSLSVGGSGVGGGGIGGNGSGGGGSDSLSSSPSQHHHLQAQQNVDDVNTRNNFLQGNFFNRKRSGSIEGISPTTAGPNLIAALSSNDTATVGTWKLIKGKVSQTFEDIKSAKSSSQALSTSVPKVESPRQYFLQQPNDPDSDTENLTAHSSISDELSLDFERKLSSHTHVKGDESDSSFDGEQILEGEVERSRLRRGLANLKSKVTSKAHHQQQATNSGQSSVTFQQAGLGAAALSSATISTAFGAAAIKPMKKEGNNTSAASSNASLRDTILRRRRPSPTEPNVSAAMIVPQVDEEEKSQANRKVNIKDNKKEKKRHIIPGKKIIEIESGVEMMEDTLPTINANDNVNVDEPETSARLHKNLKQNFETSEGLESTKTITKGLQKDTGEINQNREAYTLGSAQHIEQANKPIKKFAPSMPISRLAGLLIVLLLPVHSFIRGVLACLMTFAIADSLSLLAQSFIFKVFQHHPEKSDFEIPDYKNMPICKVPAVEEHKTIKSYAGWMNEIFSYDPLTFHVSQTNSVYLRLDGTQLRVSTTTARIPKRIVWNEQLMDIHHIPFTNHRTYNLLGCSVELLPLGLARKRYFNRKYPIQLIIKNGIEDDSVVQHSENPSTLPSARGSKSDLNSMDSRISQISSDILEQFMDIKEKETNSNDLDFASAVMNADLQQLQDNTQDNDKLIPCGDEVRLVLFSRGDREKEDWYRRFVAASEGDVHDQVLHLLNLKLVDDAELQRAAAKAAQLPVDPNYKRDLTTNNEHEYNGENESQVLLADIVPPLVIESKLEKAETYKDIPDDMEVVSTPVDTFEGLLMSSCAARNPQDYIRFMAIYQNACRENKIPVYSNAHLMTQTKKSRRSKRHANELWKGIDQSLFLGPSGSVVWANVLIGRVLYSCLHDQMVKDKIKDLLQKKISAIKLPSFIEDVVITKINFGDTPPLIHRISQPMLDERGTWVDADVTYEGLLQLTVTTKLNLMRIKQQKRPQDPLNITVTNPLQNTNTNTNINPNITAMSASAANITSTTTTTVPPINVITDGDNLKNSHNKLLSDDTIIMDDISASAIFDSDAESTGDSDTDPESFSAPTGAILANVSTTGASTAGTPTQGENAAGTQQDHHFIPTAPGNARRIFRIVDRIAASNLFQYATDLPVVQRAIENMNTNITLRVDLRGLVGRGVINIPPPPSDRVWLAFRGPPRLWLSAKPALGEKSVDYTIVTSIIESKLCEVVNKFLVYPNMVDVTIPFLGQPTYEYLRGEKPKPTE